MRWRRKSLCALLSIATLLLLGGCTEPPLGSKRAALGAADVGARLLRAPEQEVSPPRYGLSPQGFSNPRVAVNGSGQYLVGYLDRRGDDSGWYAGDNLRLTRVSAGGALLDPGGIELQISGPSRSQIAIASDGTDYLVAWIETTDYEESKVVFARVGQDGQVLQPPTDLQAQTKVQHYAPQLCFDGVEYKLVFSGFDNVSYSGASYAARLSRQGGIISVAALPTTAGKDPSRASIACGAQVSLVAWSETGSSGAELRVLSWPSQQPPPSASSALSLPGVTRTGWVGLASGGGGFLSVWEEERGQGTGLQLVGQLLTSSGARTSTSDRLLGAAQATFRYPILRYDGSAFRLLTQELVANDEQAMITTLDASGAVGVATSALTSGDRHYPSGLACRGDACLVVWTTGPALDYFAEATRLGAANQPLDDPPLILATPSDEQLQLRLASDQSQVLFSWIAARGREPFELLFRRQDLSGNWLDPAPVALAPGRDATYAPLFSSALPGGGFAAVYALPDPQSSGSDRELRVSVISPAGQPTSPAPFSNFSDEDLTGLVCNAAECLVLVWDYFQTYAYRLSHQGVLQTAGRQTFGCQGTLAAVGDSYWCVAPSTSASGLSLQRFDTALAAQGGPLLIPQPGEEVGGAVVLAGAGDVLLAWNTASTAGVKLKAARINLAADAVLAGPTELVSHQATSFSLGDLTPLSVFSVGGKTFLLWRATDGQLVYRPRLQELSTGLSLVGELTEPDPGATGMGLPQAIGTAAGELLLAYIERDSDPQRGSHRIKYRHSAAAPQTDGGAPAQDLALSADAYAGGEDGGRDLSPEPDRGTALDGRAPPDTAPGQEQGPGADSSAPLADGGLPPDGASSPAQEGGASESEPAGGCACEHLSPGESDSAMVLLLLGAALWLHRRRAGAGRPGSP